MIPRLFPLAVLALAPALAQADELTVTRSGGVLGGLLSYDIQGDPLETFFLVPSVSQGPIPVALFCTGDPRIIQVGTELQSFGALGVLSPTGQGQANYPMPPSPSLQGIAIYAQCMTLFGSTCLIDDLSDQNAFVLAANDTVHNTLGLSVTARQGHTATALNDGTVLIAGGDEPNGAGVLSPVDTLELYDPQAGFFLQLGTLLTHARSTHTATRLDDGRVLLLGGYDATNTVVATGDIYDPATGTVTPTAPMSVARTQHTATLMADGRVFVAAGSAKFDLSDVLATLAQAHRSVEVYDPATDAWTQGADIPITGFPTPDGLVGQAAALLGNGQILLSGGVEVSVVFGFPIPAFSARCHRFDPTTGTWTPGTPDLPSQRVYHGQVALPDGSALVVGGADGDFGTPSFNTLSSCARYDPASNTWTSVASLNKPRAYPNVVVTGTEVLVLGGLGSVDVSTGSGTPEQVIETTPPTLSGWTPTGGMLLPREVARAAAIDGDDRILIVGTGDNGVAAVDRTAEVYVR